MDVTLAGSYNLKVVASATLMEKVRAAFDFKLKLHAPFKEEKFNDLVISVDSVGPLLYELPEHLKNANRMDLGRAESFLAYDAPTHTISKPDETYEIPNGIYKVTIFGRDEKREEAWRQSILFLIG